MGGGAASASWSWRHEYWRLLLPGSGRWRRAGRSGSRRKTGYRWRAETRRAAAAAARRVRRGRTGTCRCWSASGSPPCAAEGLGVREIARRIGRAPSTVSRELRRNCARTTTASMTATSPMPALGSERGARGGPGSATTPSCARRCRPSWSWSGARSRSPAWLRATYPRPAGLARVPRDDLPGALPRRATAG